MHLETSIILFVLVVAVGWLWVTLWRLRDKPRAAYKAMEAAYSDLKTYASQSNDSDLKALVAAYTPDLIRSVPLVKVNITRAARYSRFYIHLTLKGTSYVINGEDPVKDDKVTRYWKAIDVYLDAY